VTGPGPSTPASAVEGRAAAMTDPRVPPGPPPL
jgi:hypothetical protein